MTARERCGESLFGSPVERIEDLRLLRSRGPFVDDLHEEGMLHGAFLRSPVARGRIRSIDVPRASALPGVHAVFTASEVAQVPTATDFPNVRAVVLASVRSPCSPLGAKGGGEGSIGPVPGVIADAVAAALSDFDAQPHELPLTPQKVWKLIGDIASRRRGTA